MPNLKIFATIVFCVTILVMGLEYLPKFYAQPATTQTVEAKVSVEVEEKVLQAKEETKRIRMGQGIVGYFLLLSLLLYLKILMQRSQKLE